MGALTSIFEAGRGIMFVYHISFTRYLRVRFWPSTTGALEPAEA